MLGSVQRLREYRGNHRWFLEHETELLRSYPEELVAVFDGKVVAHHSDAVTLRLELQSRQISNAFIGWLATRDAEEILWSSTQG